MKSPDKADDGCGIGAAFKFDEVMEDVGGSSARNEDTAVMVAVGVVVLVVVVVVVVNVLVADAIGAANNKCS